MHCPTCGARNDDEARFCVNCGQKLEAEESLPGSSPPYQRFGGSTYEPFGDSDSRPQHIPNYLIPSILVTIFCCPPLGIAGHHIRGSGKRKSRRWRYRRRTVGIPYG